MLWKVQDNNDAVPTVYPVEGDEEGLLACGCCVIFATRGQAKRHELKILRNLQELAKEELAIIDNHIVTVMRELDITVEEENGEV